MSNEKASNDEWTVEKALEAAGIGKASSLMTFFSLAGRLKITQREGWKRFGIKPESVADHSYRMAMMALTSAPEGVDRSRCVQLCLVHDIAESLVGDITPLSGVPRAEKARREAAVVDYVAETLGLAEVRALWREFEDGATPEARFAQDLDKLEMIVQAGEYEEREGKDLGEFFGAASKIKTERGRELAREVLGDRKVEIPEELRKLHDAYYD